MLVSGKTRSGAAASGETQAYIAKKHKMASAVTVSAIDSGRTSETLRLDTTVEIPTACTDISIVSTKLDDSLTRIEITLMASCATFMPTRNSDWRLWHGGHVEKRL